MRTKVVNMRATGGRAPAGSVRIDRRTRWGNPFRLGPGMERARAIREYREWLWDQVRTGAVGRAELAELHGRTLACWCAPLPCHGEVLARAAAWAAGAAGRPEGLE